MDRRWTSRGVPGAPVHRVGPVPVPHISTGLSLAVIGGVLLTVTVTSLLATRLARPRRERDGV
jgi:hypothetical protein